MFEPVWIIKENTKPRGPTRHPHCPNNGAAVLTAFGPCPLFCPPTASPPSHCPRPPPHAALKRSAPPRGLLFSSSTHFRHYAIMSPSLSNHETPPQSPSEVPVTAPSSAPTSGAPPTSLPVPSASPPLHHRCSSLAEPSHRGQPAPSLLRPQAERLCGLVREGRGQMGLAHSNSAFFRINSKFNSNLV
jgi:hypothetical protein